MIDFNKLEQFIKEERKEETKVCSLCKEDKPVSRFSKTPYDKLTSWCKDCSAARTKARYHSKKLSESKTAFAS